MNEKWQYVHIYAGAAVYFGFRSKQAPYLLIDIAEKLEKCNVIRLARCYLKLLNYVRSDCLTGEIVTH
jgi:transcription factor IIIB subunit 2